MRRFGFPFLFVLLLPLAAGLSAQEYDEVQPSTMPIGSPFYRHLASDLNVDLKELYKFERRGFGRGEIVTIVLISKSSGTVLKEYGKRRIKDKVLLRDLAAEAGLDYDTLYKVARTIKEAIEAKTDRNLPPPVYEAPVAGPSPKPKPEKKRRRRKNSGAPDAAPTAVPTPAPTPRSG